MKKISRTKLLTGLLFLGFVVLVRYAMRDMQLDVDLLREGVARMPGVVMENIQLERAVSGDMWRVRVPVLERLGDAVSVRSVDVRRSLSSGGEWYFFGSEGVYSHDVKAARLRGLLGTLETSGRVWNLESAELCWVEERSEFTFPEGLILYDQEFFLKTAEASMDESGLVLLEKGGSLQWTRPLS